MEKTPKPISGRLLLAISLLNTFLVIALSVYVVMATQGLNEAISDISQDLWQIGVAVDDVKSEINRY